MRTLTTSVLAVLAAGTAVAIETSATVANTSDVRPVPNAVQLERHADGQEIIGIVHWGLNTFYDREWGNGDEDPARLDPSDFDADQIVRACKDGGIVALTVVAKHHDGFCLWPTKTTGHNITKSPFRGGKGDYVGEMAAACRKAGVKFGVYCSPWDRNSRNYGGPAYVRQFHDQVRELLDGRYGEVFEMWFDGANGGDGYYGGAREKRKIPNGYYRFEEVFRFVRELQPGVCIFGMGGEYRWPGNERGYLEDNSRATIGARPEGLPHLRHINRGNHEGTSFQICEADFPLRKGWFFHASEQNTVRSGEFLMQRYLLTVGNGGAMNIGIAPNRHGLLDAGDVAALKRFAEVRRAFFAREAKPGEPFNVIVMTEDVANGELVDGWEFRADGKALFAGESIGIKRIRVLREPVVAKALELKVTKSAGPSKASYRLYRADPALVGSVLDARTANGETATAGWMTKGK